jgi:hypothetical protein
MGTMQTRALFLAALCCMALAAPQPVLACSGGSRCPRSLTVPADGGRLPENMRGLLWRKPCRGELEALRPTLTATTPDGATHEVPLEIERAGAGSTVQVRWAEALPEGTQLTFRFNEPEGDEQDAGEALKPQAPERRSITFRISEAAERPETLGVLMPTRAFGVFPRASGAGDCSHFVQAHYVDLQPARSPSASPWKDALGNYKTLVDEEAWAPYRQHSLEGQSDRWIGGSTLGSDRERVYLPCAVPAYTQAQFDALPKTITPGAHTVRMVASLPDGTEVSSRSYTFTLRCPAELPDAGITELLAPWLRGPREEADGGAPGSAVASGSSAAASGSCTTTRPVAAGSGARWWWLVLSLLGVRVGWRRAAARFSSARPRLCAPVR